MAHVMARSQMRDEARGPPGWEGERGLGGLGSL